MIPQILAAGLLAALSVNAAPAYKKPVETGTQTINGTIYAVSIQQQRGISRY